MKLTELKTTDERLQLLSAIVQPFSERARKYDETGTFPFENFLDLKKAEYLALTIPEKYGGVGISLVEMLRMQELIAAHDGSTALSVGWHMGITKHLGETDSWAEETYKEVAADVIATGALINNAATEPATGSPTRGGKPETTATKAADGWIVYGRKSFTTLAPILDYFVVSASIIGTDQVGNFLIRRELEGVSIDETWDSIAMRATGSHDLVLDQVSVRDVDLVQYLTPGDKAAQGWLLHIPACYLGIAKAAQQYAVEFASSYSPSSMQGTIADIPTVKQKIGEMELRIFENTEILYGVARKWDEASDQVRQKMKPELGAAKLSVVNRSLEVVDIAMRIVGARSLSAINPLQRYYRDIRAGLHNPPMDDMTIMLLAQKSLSEMGKGK